MPERNKDVLEDALAVNYNHLVLIYLQDVKVVGYYLCVTELCSFCIVCDGVT